MSVSFPCLAFLSPWPACPMPDAACLPACYTLQLASLPDGIGALAELDALSAHKNCLTALPASISRLSKLSRLSLYENELASLGPELGSLSGVQEL